MTARSLIAEARAALQGQAPFAQMEAAALDDLAARLQLAYYRDGEELLVPDGAVPERCFIVSRGVVQGVREGMGAGDAQAVQLTAGEMFPVGALLARRPVGSRYRAVGDTFCWTLSRDDFEAIAARSPAFVDFCRRRLGALLDLSNQALQAEAASRVSDWRSYAAPVGSLTPRRPLVVAPDTPLAEALRRMSAQGADAVLVCRDDTVLGIATRQDAIDRVLLPGGSLQAPVSAAMSAPVETIDAAAPVVEALWRMAERGYRQLPVLRDGRLAGLLSERELFAMQRLNLREIGDAIRRATDVPAIAAAAGGLQQLSRALVAQGLDGAFVTRVLSRHADLITERVLAIESARLGIGIEGLCWLAYGSLGRREQGLFADQDNGLVLADGVGDVARAGALAQAVNDSLAACGFAPCPGGVMAGHEAWRATESDWRARFEAWVDAGDPARVLRAVTALDARPVAGDLRLGARVAQALVSAVAASPRFMKQMAQQSLRHGPPVAWTGGLIEQWFAADARVVDLKLRGTMPLVDGVRVLAVAHGIAVTGTQARLDALKAAGRLADGEARDWSAAFAFLQTLRLRRQQAGHDDPNVCDTRELSSLDRRILKESFRQARKLQQRLAADYPG